MAWADKYRKLKVRTNADTPADAKKARELGAEGIGLCRTEHMFFEEDRIAAFREMICSDTVEEREAALEKILPYQQNLCKHRFQRIYPAGKIYDRCSPCTGNPVLRRIPDPAEDLHRTESDKIHQEIFPGYGICILNSYIQCHDPDVH